ncbi:MAG: FGGY-family carbohydrate kinase [Candidatus Nanopelagicales bacterium]
MGERWILAVDLGNGGPKVGVVTQGGEIVAAAHRGVRLHVGLDGAATQDAREWWVRLVEAVHDVLARSGADPAALHAVGITGQWASTVPVGADGQPAGDVLLWADTRAGRHMRDVIGGPVSVQGYAPDKLLPWIRTTGGAPATSGADPTGHSLLLQRDLRDVYERTVVLLEPLDYLGLRFTGRAAATPASMTASWLTDNRIGAPHGYVDNLVRRSRRDRDRLPELLPTGSVLGPLLPEVAEELGVAGGVPVVCGVPDVHAAVVGSGAVEPFHAHLAISTTSWISSRVPFKKTDALHQMATMPGLDPAHPLVANNQETGGAALQWLREQVIAPHDGLLGGGSGIGADGAAPDAAPPSFEQLISLAEDVPAGAEGVIFTPWLAGERTPVDDKNLRASFLNMSLRTDRAMLVRAVLEGVAYNNRWMLDRYEKFVGRPVTDLRVLGGGAQSDLWCQIIAGVFDRRVEQVLDARNAQLRGAALWARMCLGEIRLEDVPPMVPTARVFEPVAADREAYAEVYAVYRRLASQLKGIHRKLNAGR